MAGTPALRPTAKRFRPFLHQFHRETLSHLPHALAKPPEEIKNCQWLNPEVVPQIDFREWTPDGHLRHPVFVGLRDDKDAHAVTLL
jgi:ATP-dependent DNA ligase